MAVYSSELDYSAPGTSPDVLLKDRLERARERLDSAVESLELICEPVEPPKGELEHIHHFCGNTEIPTDLQEREPQRAALYKATVSFARAYANIVDELADAGYANADIARIRGRLDHFVKLRDTIRNAAGESLDLKPYEADMRHLIDTFIEADTPRKISPFENLGLLDLIVKTGIADAIAARLSGLKGNQRAIAETIENNLRSKIVREQMNDPTFYENMSVLLDEVIADRKANAIAYEKYLQRIAEIVRQIEAGHSDDTPEALDSPGKRAIHNFLTRPHSQSAAEQVVEAPASLDGEITPVDLALKIDETMQRVRPDSWRGNQAKEQIIKAALYGILQNELRVEQVFQIISAQREY